MARLSSWLQNQEIYVRTPGDGPAVFSARIIGVRGAILVLNLPRAGNRTLWPRKGSTMVIGFPAGAGAARAEATVVVVDRRLKPFPLLITQAREDIPLCTMVEPRRSCRTLAVTSGKGGTGKTFLAVNLAVALSRQGHRVALLDGDLGAASVSAHLGVKPSRDLREVLHGRSTVAQVAFRGPYGLTVVPGPSASPEEADTTRWQLGRLAGNLGELEKSHDFVLLDTGAGYSAAVTTFLLTADEVILVTGDEVPALINAYGILKLLDRQAPHRRVHVVVNKVSARERARQRVSGLCDAATRHLAVHPRLLGLVASDPRVPESLERQKPCLILFPEAEVSQNILHLIQELARSRP